MTSNDIFVISRSIKIFIDEYITLTMGFVKNMCTLTKLERDFSVSASELKRINNRFMENADLIQIPTVII